VLAHSCATPDEELVVLHNLSRRPCELRPNLGGAGIGSLYDIFSDRVYGPSAGGADGVQLAGYGYRWFRCDGSWHEPH
jgi:maltose alpha-D-glucosyltransferase / alpha-amylase